MQISRPDNGGVPEVFLKPGEMFLAREPTILKTILGSCVGVTFWSQKLGAGALCHAVLPEFPSPSAQDAGANGRGFRYVDFCIRSIARRFDGLGAQRREVEVKLFGGADSMFSAEAGIRLSVGRQNTQTAVQILREEGLGIAATKTGGTCGLRIRFDTGSGAVDVFQLPARSAHGIASYGR